MNRAAFQAMGSDVIVAGASPDELAAIEDLFRTRNLRFSRFVESSELNCVNRSPQPALRVSVEFARMTALAIRAAEETDGLVDPSVGAAIVALGYDRHSWLLDPDERPVVAAPAGLWRAIRVHGTLLERPAGLVLDLNGVVKGRTVDDAAGLMRGSGFVSAGGDIRATGPVDIAVPDGHAIRLERGGLATSGIGTRTWLRGGKRRHHLVEPATGLSADSPWAAVTVAAASCLGADVAAKAALLLGEGGPTWLDARQLAGSFVRKDGSILVNATWRTAVAMARVPAA